MQGTLQPMQSCSTCYCSTLWLWHVTVTWPGLVWGWGTFASLRSIIIDIALTVTDALSFATTWSWMRKVIVLNLHTFLGHHPHFYMKPSRVKTWSYLSRCWEQYLISRARGYKLQVRIFPWALATLAVQQQSTTTSTRARDRWGMRDEGKQTDLLRSLFPAPARPCSNGSCSTAALCTQIWVTEANEKWTFPKDPKH